MNNGQGYRTVDIERRGYGRRYTWLPVDSLSRDAFTIDCAGAYLRPEHFDIRVGDIVRWRDSERLLQGRVAEVRRSDLLLEALLADVELLPPEAFYP